MEKKDYAKWMLEDPKVNFAISMRGNAIGVDHFGFQVENDEDMEGLKKLAEAAANNQVLSQKETVCCYAKSNKHWIIDPQGIAWEHFHSLKEAINFGGETKNVLAKSGNCGSNKKTSNGSACC